MVDRKRWLIRVLAASALSFGISGCELGGPDDDFGGEAVEGPAQAHHETDEDPLTRQPRSDEGESESAVDPYGGKSDHAEPANPHAEAPEELEGEPAAEGCEEDADPLPMQTQCEDDQGKAGHGSPQPLDPHTPPSDDADKESDDE